MKIEDAAIYDLVKFFGLDETYKVMARDKRFLVCTSLFTVEMQNTEYDAWVTTKTESEDEDYLYEEAPYVSDEDTVYYTLIDLENKIRSTDNYGGLGYETKEECWDVLKKLQSGDAELSRRYKVPLRVESVNVGNYCRWELSHRGEPTLEIGCTDGSEFTTMVKLGNFEVCPYCDKEIRVFGERS